MKKFIAILLTLAVVLAFGAACTESGPSYSVDSDGNLTINEPIVLRFAAPEGKFEAEIEKFKVGFKKLYPEVTIKFEPIAGEWTSQLLMQLRNGSAPDIFWTEEVFSYASLGLIEPLDRYFDAYNVDRSNFYESMLNVGKYNGELYMMPREYNKVVCYYNKKLFDRTFNAGQYSLEKLPPFTYDTEKYAATQKFYPANGWTWDEFIATAAALVQRVDGQIATRGADISVTWGSSGPNIFESLGGTIRTEQNGAEKITFDTPSNRAVMQQILDYMKQGVFLDPVHPDTGEFINGKVGMFFSSRPDTKTIDSALDGEWDVVTFPLIGENPHIVTGCSGYVVNAASKVKEVAMRLLFYMVSEEGQLQFSETGNCVPVLKSLKDSTVWRTYPKADANHDAFLWGEQYDDVPYKFKFTNTNAGAAFESTWKNEITEIVRTGNVASMADAQKEFDKIFDNYAV